jgi:predicted enzyme involved in methoxymalonyl-ACP biosynthesis
MFYQNPTFPSNQEYLNDEVIEKETNDKISLGSNKNKRANIYASFPNSNEIKEFSGIIDYYNDNEILINDTSNNKWYLIKKEYINYIEFLEKPNI